MQFAFRVTNRGYRDEGHETPALRASSIWPAAGIEHRVRVLVGSAPCGAIALSLRKRLWVAQSVTLRCAQTARRPPIPHVADEILILGRLSTIQIEYQEYNLNHVRPSFPRSPICQADGPTGCRPAVHRAASCWTWLRAQARPMASRRRASGAVTSSAHANIRCSCSTSSPTSNVRPAPGQSSQRRRLEERAGACR